MHDMQASGYADPEKCEMCKADVGRRRGDASSKMVTFPNVSAQLLAQAVADCFPEFYHNQQGISTD
jgi:hypothetical protein